LQKGLDVNLENSSAKRRGPRREFSDPQLGNRRDQLVQVFEGAWGEIGWELSHCEDPDELATVLGPLLQTYAREMLLAFCYPSPRTSDWAALRKVRKRRRALVPRSYSLAEASRRTYDNLHLLDGVLTQKPDRRSLKREQKKRRKEYSEAEQEARAFRGEWRELEEEERALEASVARQELFRFLKSKRYELTPLSLANALANVPYSGWRQSMRRCIKLPCAFANGQTYQLFKAIRYLAAKARKGTERVLVADFRAGILLLPSRHSKAKASLVEDWFYIERAIKQVFRTNPIVPAIPFKILDQYLKQLQQRSRADMVLAAQRKIELPKRIRAASTRRIQ
jgi:hypothetical protein